MTETDRVKRNQDRLEELFPAFAVRIRKVIASLEDGGLRPRIQDAYRSPKDQLTAFNNGNSKVKFGFHNVTRKDGTPESLAVDMLDDDHPLTPPTSYLLRLAAAANDVMLETGITWGLPANLRKGILNTITAGNFNAQVKVGWDPTHIQPTGLTIAEARQGKRPD